MYLKNSLVGKIMAIEHLAPLVTCDNCGEERKCKLYHLNEGSAILCHQCFTKERIFQTSDKKGYTICDGSPDYYKRNFQSWYETNWYGLPELEGEYDG